MEFETGRRSTLARLQLSVQGLAGSLNSAKKVLVASTVLTAAFCGAIFGLTLVANEASKESHVSNGLLTTVDGDIVNTKINKGMTSLSELSAEAIAKQDFVTFSQDGADRFMQILGVQATASKKVINTIVGAFEVTEEGMTFAGDNVVIEASEADKAARKAQCKFCSNGRSANCAMCSNTGRSFLIAGRNPMCAICNNQGRNFQCKVCSNGRTASCAVCTNQGRANQCKMCSNGRNGQCIWCTNGRNVQCSFCSNQGRNGQGACNLGENADQDVGDSDTGADSEIDPMAEECAMILSDPHVPEEAIPPHCLDPWTMHCFFDDSGPECGGSNNFDVTKQSPDGGIVGGIVNPGGEGDIDALGGTFTLCELADSAGCYGEP